MTYHVFQYIEGRDYIKVAELTPPADADNCWFGDVRLWTAEHGFLRGQIKVGTFWLLDEDEHKAMLATDEEIAEELAKPI